MADDRSFLGDRWPLWGRAVFLFAAYILAAELGNLLSLQRTFSTFWPPAGLFVGMLLISDPRDWPVLIVSGILGNVTSDSLNGRALAVTLGFSTGNALEALAGAALVRRFGGTRLRLDSLREIVAIALFAALVAPMLSATVGTLVVGAAYGTADWWTTWRIWWIGDTVGVVVFAPLLLAVAAAVRDARSIAPDVRRALFKAWGQVAVSAAVMAAATWIVFSPDLGDARWKFLLILGSLVSAMAFGPLGGAVVLTATAIAAVASLAHGGGTIAAADLPNRLLETQTFIAVTGIALLALAAVDARNRAVAAEARAVAEKLRVVFDEFPLGVSISDADGNIVETSARAEQILGITGEDQRARGIAGPEWRLIRPDGTALPVDEFPSVRAFEDGAVVSDVEMGVVKPEGTTWINVTAAPLSAEGYGVAVAYSDVTQQREDRERRIRSEADLAAARDNLELEVARRTRELETTNVELRRASEAKSRFLGNVSHELRTPLNSIIGFTGVMLQGLTGPVNSEQERELRMVKRSGEHLLELVNDLLDLTKIESGKTGLDVGEFTALEVLTAVADTVRPLAEAKGLTFEIPLCEEIRIRGDFGKVRQILLNLLANAVKFTDAGSVTADCELAGDTVCFTVRDTGIGIAADALPWIMDEFVQVDRADGMKPAGTGLGLAISRRLALLMGGSLSVSSAVGEGSTFTLSLPVSV